MKKLFSTIALVTVLATPALAQSWDPDVGSGNITAAPYGENLNGSSVYQNDGFNARAEAPRHMGHMRHMTKTKASQSKF